MAKNDSNDSGSSNSGFRYYKTRKAGLRVVVGDPDPTKGEVAPKTVPFIPYFVYERGVQGKQKYGFLKTDDESVIAKLDGDFSVTEIKKEEFDDATKVVKDESGTQISGFRAPH